MKLHNITTINMISLSLSLLAFACVAMDVELQTSGPNEKRKTAYGSLLAARTSPSSYTVDNERPERALRDLSAMRAAPPSPRLLRDPEEKRPETPPAGPILAVPPRDPALQPRACAWLRDTCWPACTLTNAKGAACSALGVVTRLLHGLARPFYAHAQTVFQCGDDDDGQGAVRSVVQRGINRDDEEGREAILAQSRGCNNCESGCGRRSGCCPCVSKLLCKAACWDSEKPWYGCDKLPWDAEREARNEQDLFPPRPRCFGRLCCCTPCCETRDREDSNDLERAVPSDPTTL